MRLLFIAFFSMFIFSAAYGDSFSPLDKSQMQQAIDGQLQAFKADDGARAYSYAAPLISQIFPSVDQFMTMVKRGYTPVYSNQKYSFGQLSTDANGRPAQHVLITGTDGKTYDAVYFMELEADGSWKIAGCSLAELPNV